MNTSPRDKERLRKYLARIKYKQGTLQLLGRSSKLDYGVPAENCIDYLDPPKFNDKEVSNSDDASLFVYLGRLENCINFALRDSDIPDHWIPDVTPLYLKNIFRGISNAGSVASKPEPKSLAELVMLAQQKMGSIERSEINPKLAARQEIYTDSRCLYPKTLQTRVGINSQEGLYTFYRSVLIASDLLRQKKQFSVKLPHNVMQYIKSLPNP